MIDWQALVDGINAQLGHPTAIRALVIGFVCSIGLTQIAKFSPSLAATSDRYARAMTRLFAFAAAALPAWALWPEPGLPGMTVALALGLITPTLYTIAVRIAVHFFPWLDDKLSARPQGKTP